MKTFFMIIGILAVLAILIIGTSTYFTYKKAASAVSEISHQKVEEIIRKKIPSVQVMNSLRRLVSASDAHPSVASTLVSIAVVRAFDEKDITDEMTRMLDEGVHLVEQEDIPKEQLQSFFKKYDAYLNHRTAQPVPQAQTGL